MTSPVLIVIERAAATTLAKRTSRCLFFAKPFASRRTALVRDDIATKKTSSPKKSQQIKLPNVAQWLIVVAAVVVVVVVITVAAAFAIVGTARVQMATLHYHGELFRCPRTTARRRQQTTATIRRAAHLPASAPAPPPPLLTCRQRRRRRRATSSQYDGVSGAVTLCWRHQQPQQHRLRPNVIIVMQRQAPQQQIHNQQTAVMRPVSRES